MKTINEFLNELPDELRERALNNTRTLNADPVTLLEGAMYGSIDQVIMAIFVWEESPEGHEFWSKVRDHYEYPEAYDLPELP